MDLNSKIRDLIDAKINNAYAYNDEDLKYSVIKYTECSDFDLKESDIEVGLKRLYEYLNMNSLTKNKSCIITNSVNGKIANLLTDNIYINSFDNDFYCSMASQIVNKDKYKIDMIDYLFGDISQFFTSNFNSNFKTDFIITCPSRDTESYKHLDSEMKFRKMNPYEYYTKRSLEFLFDGGLCLSIIPVSMERFVIKQLMEYEIPVKILDKINFGVYSFIYIIKG
jgi:hypothetical protein